MHTLWQTWHSQVMVSAFTIWNSFAIYSAVLYTGHDSKLPFSLSQGSYILSGGEESVLVLWQFKTHHKQFLPRLGAPIKHICSSSDDTLIAVSHMDNGKRVSVDCTHKI